MINCCIVCVHTALTVVYCPGYKSFLSQHTLSTRVGNYILPELNLLSGVIQGSGIGPLLFVSYINELAKVLGNFRATVKFFADDLKMYAEIKLVLMLICFNVLWINWQPGMVSGNYRSQLVNVL